MLAATQSEDTEAQQPFENQQLILFGSVANQAHMLRIARRERIAKGSEVGRPLRNSGLLALRSRGGKLEWNFDQRHPAYLEMLQAMRDIGAPDVSKGDAGVPKVETFVSHTSPLGHRSPHAFRVLAFLTKQSQPVTWLQLRATLDFTNWTALRNALNDLARDRVIVVDREKIALSPLVPPSFKHLIVRIASVLAESDGRYADLGVFKESRPPGMSASIDQAPMLFKTDARLRNLMALAREGPLHITDLQKITGLNHGGRESRDDAPFGRAAVVRMWDTDAGPAAMLDPDFPLAGDLRRLLLRLLEKYPLPPLSVRRKAPAIPNRHKWVGDYHVILGGENATSILTTIGALGWTFTALSANALPGVQAESIRATCARLEADGIIKSDRPARPGMDARVLRLDDSFYAHDELGVLLRRCVKVWPAFANRANIALQTLSPKTKAHLRKRGLIGGADTAPDHERYARMPHQASNEERQSCIDDYFGLSNTLGAEPSSFGLMKADSRLYRRIRVQWGTFAAFRAELGLRRVRIEAAEPPDPARRDRCIAEYRAYADYLGRLPTSEDLRRSKGWLYQRISQIWGGFPHFCEDLGIKPIGGRRSAKLPDELKRARCINQYKELSLRLGKQPMSHDLNRHSDGLYRRIRKLWGGFPEFCDEISLPTNGRRNRRKPEKA